MFRFLQITIVLLLFSGQFLPAQWVQTNGPCGGYLADFASKGDSMMSTVRSPGGFTVYRSTNRGDSWQETYSYNYKPYSPPFTTVDAIVFVSGNTFYLANAGKGLLSSTDFGENWEDKSSGFPNDPVWSLSELNGTLYAGTYAGVYQSTNKGTTWTYYNKLARRDLIELIQFGELYIAGTGAYRPGNGAGIYISKDKGASWTRSASGLPADMLVNHVCIHNSRLFAMVIDEQNADHRNFVYRYNEASSTWEKVLQGDYNADGVLAQFGNTLVVVADSVYHSTNNGDTWKSVGIPPYYPISTYKSKEQGNTIFARHPQLGLVRSNDGGITWSEANTGIVLQSAGILIANGSTVFATSAGRLLRTTDNGQEWKELMKQRYYVDNIFHSGTTLFALAYETSTSRTYVKFEFLRSTDEGESWSSFLIATPTDTIGVPDYNGFAFSATSVFTADIRKGVFRSNDNGTTWQKLGLSFNQDNYQALVFARGNTVFVGMNGPTDNVYYRSTDNGDTWQTLRADNVKPIGFLFHKDIIFGVEADFNTIYRSVDNGISWQKVNYEIKGTIWQFNIYPAGNNLFGTDSGVVYKVSDNGDDWQRIGMTDVNTLAATSSHLFASRISNGVWRRPLSDIVSVEEQGAVATNVGIIPNPVTAVATITLQAEAAGSVRLGVFDLFGREIAVLCNETLAAGNHSFTWDGRDGTGDLLPAGVYFCRVQTPSGSEVRELVVVR